MIGILLAAGYSKRFGTTDKLLHKLPTGCPIALTSGISLVKAVPMSIAVIRPENIELGQLLADAGLKVFYCRDQDKGMADSLSSVIRFSARYDESQEGFIIALADMPFIDHKTIASVASKLNDNASIVIPTYQSKRGHPVGFSAKFREDLENLHGDEGARSVLKRYPEEICLLECNDAGILYDVDTPEDLIR